MRRFAAALLAMAPLGPASSAVAQKIQRIDVDGRAVRVWTAGLESAGDSVPTVVFESGFMFDGLRAWASVLSSVADFAPVIAYDRAGIGESDPDGKVPTPRHVAANLHALLDALSASPPYVLVGHSLGGVFIRIYAEMYPEEVAGLTYIDPTAPMSSDEMREYDRAMGISIDGRRKLNAAVRESFDDLPNASIRAEADDDPELVVWSIRRVVEAVARSRASTIADQGRRGTGR